MILFFVGCAHTEKVNAKFTQLINEQSNKSSDLLKLDGAYHHISQESYHYPVDYKNGVPTRYIDSPYLEQPLFFFSNGIVLYEFRTTTLEAINFAQSLNDKSNLFYKEGGWGVFSIKKDTVNAVIFINFIKGLFIASNDNLQCNFQGVFKNADTILSWHLVYILRFKYL